MITQQSIRTMPAHAGGLHDWPNWAPYAAVVWSVAYAILGIYWAVSGKGFPYGAELSSGTLGPIAGRFGPELAWIFVLAAGIPAVALGMVMLRGVRGKVLRPLLIISGTLLGVILLLLMIEFSLLMQLAYIPFGIFNLIIGSEFGPRIFGWLLQSRWTIAHQLLCLIGGFLWLAATVVYTRRSGDACLYCGRRDGLQGWTSPEKARRWGRIAVYVGMVPPVLYALTRYAWAAGIPLGMTVEYWRQQEARGEWVSGLFLATVALVGGLLMLGLVQRWGEVFPRWIPGLGGRRVPMALAIVPASIMSVLFMVAGIAMWSAYAQTAAAAAATKQSLVIVVGPVLLFPIWSVGLAVATLGYYFRRRGPCGVCGRGASAETRKLSSNYEVVYPPAA